MNTETNRHEFEKWARTNTSIGLDLDMDVDDGVEHYWDHSTYAAWKAWQAARERHTPISDEAIESACDVLDDNIQSCDSGESDQERMLQEARDYLWSMHFSNNPPTSEKI
jgi:hypothetical protein